MRNFQTHARGCQGTKNSLTINKKKRVYFILYYIVDVYIMYDLRRRCVGFNAFLGEQLNLLPFT